jgi:hypothetical protein
MLDEALSDIAGRIAVDSGKGMPIVVFNPLSWPQTGPVKTVVPSLDRNDHIFDAEGRPARMQAPPANTAGSYLD